MSTLFPRGLLLSLAAALMLLAPMMSSGQTPPPYEGFKFDSVFHFGAHFNGPTQVKLAKDTLHLDFTQTYRGPSSLRSIRNSAFWHAYGTDERWVDSLNKIYYDSCAKLNFKLIYAPGDILDLTMALRGAENYFGVQDPADHLSDFMIHGTPASNDTIPHYYVWGGRFPKSSAPSDLTMAERPRYTDKGLIRNSFFSRLGYPDSSNYFDLTITMKASSMDLSALGQNDVIAYVLLSRRDTAGQNRPNTCHCNFYTRFDSIAITKAMYLDNVRSPLDPVSGYRDVTLTFTFPTGSVTSPRNIRIVPTTGDTVLAVGGGDVLSHYQPPEESWFGWGAPNGTGTREERFCAKLWDSLKAINVLTANSWSAGTTAEESDFYYSVHTKQVAEITFLRGRVTGHLYDLARRNDPKLDSLINLSIDSVLADAALDTLLMRVGVIDEAVVNRYPGYRMMASKIERRILGQRPNDTRGLWSNPIGNYGTFRIHVGDLDTTDIKMVHMMATQAYHMEKAIPIRYANPDSMAESSINSYYEMALKDDTLQVRTGGVVTRVDTVRNRFIRGNSGPDYNSYTLANQAALSLGQAELTDGVTAARTRFNYVGRPTPSYPVYDVVQVHGWLGLGPLTGHFPNGWRPTTPEEITAQSWLALHCGVDGIVFSDFTYDGAEFGVMHWLTGDHTTEYDTMSARHISQRWSPSSTWQLPKMWLGFNTRFNAVKSVIDTFQTLILPVYNKLDHNGTRMELQNTAQLFRDMPMLDTVKTEKAQQFVQSPLKGAGTYDARDKSYMEITHFRPGPQLSAEAAAGVQYLMFTNRRCWPVDFKTYNAAVVSRFDSIARWDNLAGIHCSTSGLGNIDVRRPVIVLKNTSGVIADSFKIQRVGSTIVRTVAVGSTVVLDWLTPGWGSLYKITPIPAGVSTLGTAYNNAVRAENPSTDQTQRDRIVVYERDSTIYLRTMDSNGIWSGEWMVSDPADTARTTGTPVKRKADNINPAVATVRNGNSCLVVWERRDSAGNASAEAAYFNARPTRGTTLPTKTFLRLGAQRVPFGGNNLTPAVTGADSGYVVAWAAPKPGIEVVAVRDKANPTLAADVSNVGVVFAPNVTVAYRTNMGTVNVTLDSLCLFPTLAYKRNFSLMPNTFTSFHFVHMAFQQGMAAGPFIMYKMIGAKFGGAGKPVLALTEPIEHVSRNLPSCSFYHPSIAVDSFRIAVAFESMNFLRNLVGFAPTPRRAVTLRVRDLITPTGGRVGMMWNTPAYYWGDSAADHMWPSLTEFPNIRSSWLAQRPEGALAWMRTPGPSGTSQQRFYRYGEKMSAVLPNGKYPTMMLAPFDCVTPLAASGTFYRGDDPVKFQRTRKLGGTGWYYPGVVENVPKNTSSLFLGASQPKGQILGFTAFGNYAPLPGATCSLPALIGGIRWYLDELGNGTVTTTPASSSTSGATQPPIGLPTSFFRAPDTLGTTMLDTVAKAWEITRTAPFTADTIVKVRRVLWGTDSLYYWLNGSPYDTTTGTPANIYTRLELVRASDDSLLWSSDTVSARGVGVRVLEEDVEIPVNTYANDTTPVYVRMRMYPTRYLEYDLSGGFSFEEDTTMSMVAKVVRYQGRERERTDAAVAGARMALTVVPNPLRAEGELRLRLPAAGLVSVRIFDMMGRLVRTLPEFTIAYPGDYSVKLDLEGLVSGRYSVQVESGGERGATQFAIVR